jgi:ABC-type sugar transport system substrate-binding protein
MSPDTRLKVLRSRKAVAFAATAAALAVAVSVPASSTARPAAAKGDGNYAMITASTTQNAFIEMALGAKAAAGHLGVNLKEAAPNGVNPPVEVQQFQAAEHTSKDGIAAMTTDPNIFIRPFADAVKKGIPVVAVDAAPLTGSNVTTFVGNSNTQVGQILGKAMLAKIPVGAKGEVVLGNDIPGLPLLGLRLDGMKAALHAARPGLTFLGPYNTGSEPTQNYNSWSALVKAHPNAIAYLAPGDQDAVSLYKIQKQTGKHLLVGACDVDPTALLAVQQGYVYALADPQHWLKGYIAISLLAQAKDTGKLLKGWFNPGAGLITKANVGDIIKRQANSGTRNAYYKATAAKELANPAKYIKPLNQAN